MAPRRNQTLISLNPFGWSAEPFLVFYLVIAALAFAVILLMRGGIGGNAPSGAVGNLNPLELAWLAFGRQHVADTVLLGFLQADAATLPPGKLFRQSDIRVDAGKARLPPWLEPFRAVAKGAVTRQKFRDAIAPQLEILGRGLVQRGLTPTRLDLSKLRSTTMFVLAVPLLLGTVRLVLGLALDRPVGILVTLLPATIVLGMIAIGRAPFRTRSGTTALLASRGQNARAARAPLAQELTLAFALTGAAVFAGTPYSAFGKQIQSSGDGSGCGGDGDGGAGDGGGGGCGG